MRLETLLPLLDVPGVAFVSLQHEVRAEDAPLLQARPNILQVGPDFRDFADTAAAMAQLDAVISVDTAVAHLAGAMGKPLFLLLPFAADFRWLRECRRQSVVSDRATSTASRNLAIGRVSSARCATI